MTTNKKPPVAATTEGLNETPCTVEISTARAFLHALDPTAASWNFRTFADAGAGPGKNYTGSLEQNAAALQRDNESGRGVFLVVNEGGHSGREITRVRAVFADLDGASVEPVLFCELPAHLIVETSPGKFHAYWRVDGLPLAEFKAVQQCIAARFQSDPSVCDLPRVLRLPGFIHHKAAPFLSRVLHALDAAPYSAAVIHATFPAVAPATNVAHEPGAVVEVARHDDMVRLVARLAGTGVRREAILSAIESEADGGRWTREFIPGEVERAIDGALAKYSTGEFTMPVDLASVGFGLQPLPAGATTEAPALRFRLTPANDLLQRPAPLSWLVRGLLLPGTSSMLVGDPAAGKSLAVIDWASCIAVGREWCGRAVQRGLVVYLAGEGQHGIRRRLLAWSITHGVDLKAAPIVVSDRGASLNDWASLADVVQAIDAAASVYGVPVLIVVDTLHRNLAGDESSAKDTAAYFNAVDVLRVRYGAHVLTVHHSGHGEKDRARGSSSLRAAVDTELLLTVSAGIRTLQMTKQKDGPTMPPLNLALQEVALPWLADDGVPETSVVLMPTTAVPMRIKQLSSVQRLGVESLRDSGGDRVPLEKWRVAFYAAHTGDSMESKKKAFQRVRTELVDLHEIAHDNDLYSIAGQTGQTGDKSRCVPGQAGHTSIEVSRLSRQEVDLSKVGFGGSGADE